MCFVSNTIMNPLLIITVMLTRCSTLGRQPPASLRHLHLWGGPCFFRDHLTRQSKQYSEFVEAVSGLGRLQKSWGFVKGGVRLGLNLNRGAPSDIPRPDRPHLHNANRLVIHFEDLHFTLLHPRPTQFGPSEWRKGLDRLVIPPLQIYLVWDLYCNGEGYRWRNISQNWWEGLLVTKYKLNAIY